MMGKLKPLHSFRLLLVERLHFGLEVRNSAYKGETLTDQKHS
jgi:hypothetical protein